MRVLLTGASGFIGRTLAATMRADGAEVHAVGSTPRPPADGVTWHACDLLDAVASSALVAAVRPTHLVHLAWCTEHGAFWESPANLAWVEASLRLARSFRDAGGQRFVGVGSCAEYDWSAGTCVEVSTPLRPRTLYGRAKASTWEILGAFFAGAPASFAWGRVFFPFGPHEKSTRLVPTLIRRLARDEDVPLTHGRQRRDFLYSTDVAGALWALAKSQVGGAVNLASGDAVSVRDLAETLERKLGRTGRLRFGAISLAAEEPELLVADVARLRREVGFSPGRGLDAALDETIAWWLARGNLD